MKKLLFLIGLFSFTSISQNLQGTWEGNLEVQGTTLPIVFHLQKTEAGFTAKMDSPQQQVYGIPMDNVMLKAKELVITHTAAQLTYSATLENDTTLVGNYLQRGMNIPLTLRKNSKETEAIKRPQTPKPPYPYLVEEVKFKNEKANIQLAGTLTLPKGSGKFPAVILISGSGAQNRNEEIMGHEPFLVIADELTKKGIAVLRYDDRGTASSEGDFSSATSYDFLDDAAAAIDFLWNRKEINNKKIGAIGHSEGGMIAPALANKKDLDFIVLMAGPGLEGDKLLNLQRKKMEEMQSIDEVNIMQRQAIFEEVYKVISNTELTAEKREERTFEVFKKQWGNDINEQELGKLSAQHNMPWMVEFIRWNPKKHLEKTTCPVLAIFGEKDFQVPAEENLKAMEKAFANAGNKKVTLKAYPNLNHLFQHAETGGMEEYYTIEETISPEVLEDISNWILKQTN